MYKSVYTSVETVVMTPRNGSSQPLCTFRQPLPSTPLHCSLVRFLLSEDAVHHGDEQKPHRPCRGVMGSSRTCGGRHPAQRFSQGRRITRCGRRSMPHNATRCISRHPPGRNNTIRHCPWLWASSPDRRKTHRAQ